MGSIGFEVRGAKPTNACGGFKNSIVCRTSAEGNNTIRICNEYILLNVRQESLALFQLPLQLARILLSSNSQIDLPIGCSSMNTFTLWRMPSPSFPTRIPILISSNRWKVSWMTLDVCKRMQFCCSFDTNEIVRRHSVHTSWAIEHILIIYTTARRNPIFWFPQSRDALATSKKKQEDTTKKFHIGARLQA
jgi:hypothetical protein